MSILPRQCVGECVASGHVDGCAGNLSLAGEVFSLSSALQGRINALEADLEAARAEIGRKDAALREIEAGHHYADCNAQDCGCFSRQAAAALTQPTGEGR